MLANPQPGQRAEIRYAKDRWAKWGRELLPYQGLRCTVVIASKGKPRNHLVQIDACNMLAIVPCGNLMKAGNIEPEKIVPRCGECGADMVLRYTKKYNRKFWGCSQWPQCDGTHGAHEDGRPLGRPADKETKQWRMKAHKAFDQLWKTGIVQPRRMAYRWMQDAMGLTAEQAHIGMFDKAQCQELIRLVNKALRKGVKHPEDFRENRK